MIAENELFL